MTVENFLWENDKQSVSWLYNGKTIKEKFEDMHFATLNLQKNFVYIEAGQNYSQDQIYYLSFDGKVLFSYDRVIGKIRWEQNSRLVEVDCKNIVNAQFYIEHDVIIVIAATNHLDKRMLGYSLDGTLLFEKEPPQGYSFMYLSTSENKPTVVCDGGKVNADAYGRSSWHFTISTKTGEMSKGSLAY